MSTYRERGDPATGILLDCIAEHEAGGNYNAVIGDSRATDDLSRKTLDQIYVLMARLLVKRRPSTAVGRYQIIRNTLRTLQASKKLPGSTLFTPELQDGLALSLLIGRGYSKWRTGAMSDKDFAHSLSCEWASLPDPRNGGKSHYDGIGPNHAGTTLAHVYDSLRRAREAKAGPAMSIFPPTNEVAKINTPPAPPKPKTPSAPRPSSKPVLASDDDSEAERLNREEAARHR